MRATGFAGFPCISTIGGTEVETTLPAVTMDPLPTVTPGKHRPPDANIFLDHHAADFPAGNVRDDHGANANGSAIL